VAATDYITLDDLELHLGLPAGGEFDTKLLNVIASVSRWADAYCQRHFYQDGTTIAPVARLFDARDPCRLELGDTPVTIGGVTVLSDLIEVTELATDDDADGTFETVWAPSEFQLLPLNSVPAQEIGAIGRRFPSRCNERAGLVRVTGVWGWTAVPDTVRQACLIQCARIFKRKDSPEGVSGFDQFGVIRVSGRLDPDVAANLNHLVYYPAVFA